MNFFVVFCKSKNKFDKYIKINRIRNKVIIDIKQQLEENEIEDNKKYKDYFNLLIYTKIIHAFKKNKDIYYIPEFANEKLTLEQILDMKKLIKRKSNFNILIFYDEFKNNDKLINDIFENIDKFDASQIIKDY